MPYEKCQNLHSPSEIIMIFKANNLTVYSTCYMWHLVVTITIAIANFHYRFCVTFFFAFFLFFLLTFWQLGNFLCCPILSCSVLFWLVLFCFIVPVMSFLSRSFHIFKCIEFVSWCILTPTRSRGSNNGWFPREGSR